MIWPMSIMMKAFTSRDDKEIKECIIQLLKTDANTGFMHDLFIKIIHPIIPVHGLLGKILYSENLFSN